MMTCFVFAGMLFCETDAGWDQPDRQVIVEPLPKLSPESQWRDFIVFDSGLDDWDAEAEADDFNDFIFIEED